MDNVFIPFHPGGQFGVLRVFGERNVGEGEGEVRSDNFGVI